MVVSVRMNGSVAATQMLPPRDGPGERADDRVEHRRVQVSLFRRRPPIEVMAQRPQLANNLRRKAGPIAAEIEKKVSR